MINAAFLGLLRSSVRGAAVQIFVGVMTLDGVLVLTLDGAQILTIS